MIDLNPLALCDGVPGLSVWNRKTWLHGADAQELLRQFPQGAVLDTWDQLSVNPLNAEGGVRHRADLAIAQLKAAGVSGQHNLVLVPSSWNSEPLGVLLSVLQAVQVSNHYFLPRSLALAASVNQDSFWILEQSWTGLTLSNIRNGVLQRQEFKAHEGRFDWIRALASRIAELCLERDRIDPLHSAESDQALFSGLNEAFESQAVDVVPAVGEAIFLEPIVDRVTQSAGKWIHSRVNGEEVFAEAPLAHWLTLPECHVPPGLDARAPAAGDAGVTLLEEVPGKGADSVVEQATHLLLDDLAVSAKELGMTAGVPGDVVTLPDGRSGRWIQVK